MLWTLYLAHLAGDYPLQSDWIMEHKRTWWGLAIHVAIHVALLSVLAWSDLARLWPYLLLIGLIHYAIDTIKNVVWARRPEWVTGPYLLDQLLHLLSLLLVGFLIRRSLGEGVLDYGPWPIYGVGLLLATYVWYITERVTSYDNPPYQQEVTVQRWPRMISRTLLLLAFLAIGGAMSPGRSLVTLTVALPYIGGPFGRRAFIVDVAVSLGTALLVLFGLRFT